MNGTQLESKDTLSSNDALRHIFLESLASSPTKVSSSSSTVLSPFKSKDVSIETCIEFLRSNVPQQFPEDALDEFKNVMKDLAPSNGRIKWKVFEQAAKRWMSTLDCNGVQDGNNNLNNKLCDETDVCPDDGTINSKPGVFYDEEKSSNGSEKLSEYVEWSIVPMNSMENDTVSQFDKSDVSIKSTDSMKATEVELRLRVRRINEDNAWLRDELMRTEESAANYQRQYYSIRQRFDRIHEKCSRLERENEEQKELLNNMEKEESRYQVAVEKIDKERKSLVEKLETQRQLITSLKERLQKLTNEKLDYAKQLFTCKTNLKEKEVMCDILQEKINKLSELNNDLEGYYEKTIGHLQERNEELKNENMKLLSRVGINSLNLTSSIYLDNSSADSLKLMDNKGVPHQDSLYAELKASGFSFDEGRMSSKIQDLEEELDWYNEEIQKAIEQLNNIIRQLDDQQKLEETSLNETSACQMRYILILLDKISQLSDVVTQTLQRPSKIEFSCQVSAEPLVNYSGLQQFQIPTFQDNLNKSITEGERQSSDNSKVYFTIGPAAVKSEDTEFLPRSIYTCSKRLKRKCLGRTFTPILEVTPCSGDAPINGNSSPSLHSNIVLESKINLRSAVNGDDIAPVNDALFTNTQTTENYTNDLYTQISLTSSPPLLSLSPICGTPNMTEKNVPRRKVSVFERTYDVNKILEAHHAVCSTPATNYLTTGYRTNNMDCSDSTDSFKESKLQTSIEEESLNCVGTSPAVGILAPPKLNIFISANEIKETKKQDFMSLANFKSANSDLRSEDSQVQRGGDNIAEKEKRSPAVKLAMSSGEDSCSDDCTDIERLGIKKLSQRETGQRVSTLSFADVDQVIEIEPQTLSSSNDSSSSTADKLNKINTKTFTCKSSDKCELQIVSAMKRSRSESECLGQPGYRCINCLKKPKINGKRSEESQLTSFPSLSDIQLHESGIANLNDSDDPEGAGTEDAVERKYLAFSVGLCTDRLTLARRRTLSLRQRDQIERNLTVEVARMHQYIQDLVPLCFDSETIEKIERARNQVELIAQCAHNVSCAAETLGAIQQEYRISRAIHLADRYLRMLHSRCEKYVAELAESKRILAENNIVIDEHNGGSAEEFTMIRYRGLSTTNRTMMARRRASIATISRPIGLGQDTMKDGLRQRNSVSGRVIVRRPSLSAESQRWESEKLNRTESSNSVGELRQIFEQAESRRGSMEENTDIPRLHVNRNINNNISEADLTGAQALEAWSCIEENTDVTAEIDQDHRQDSRMVSRLSFLSGNCGTTWRTMFWCILISFFIGFYVKDTVSSGPCLGAPFKWWSIEEILGRHVEVRNTAPRPI